MSFFGVRAIVHLNTRKPLDSTMPQRFHRLAAITSFVAEFLSVTSRYAQAIRQHSAIENCSHYVRDGSFREDGV
jgi:predicted transposase YbfD/YdcC